MRVLITPHVFSGDPKSADQTVRIPASKSHTIRRLLMASLTGGLSRIEHPLNSLDTQSCAAACRILAESRRSEAAAAAEAAVEAGAAGKKVSAAPRLIDVGNSGTTLFLAIAAAALGSSPLTFTGDEQIARRCAGPLLAALAGLGVSVYSGSGPGGDTGYIPITVCGPWKGGRISLSCPTSQYLSALLLAAPLAPAGTVTQIDVPLLNEKPYVEMTLSYLAAQGLYKADCSGHISAAADFSFFRIEGGAAYTPIHGPVPGDFSSAAFPAAAAIISGGAVTLRGLDPADTQGDKVFFEHLVTMGAGVQWKGGDVTVSRPGKLRGGTFDLNDTPDMLPIMAVLAAYAEGETSLVNAAHARIKETDRIAVMAAELQKLFPPSRSGSVICEERSDGLVIHGRGMAETRVPTLVETGGPLILNGHGDHRVVMALACAALGLPAGAGPVEISGAEAADVTYPGFLELLGGRSYT
ncbi:3-phosphoshikimate 1-carboxyvinyltransferase [Spirochaetia bacterium]|nr:3-phosphoshikimate 1-carboxyvinyltransferase [Spirochaetia bacterium]